MKSKFETQTPNENSIKEWAKILDTKPRVKPLSNEETKAFLFLTMNENKFESDHEFLDYMEHNRMVSLVTKRISCFHSFMITRSATVFIAMISDTPGIAVMLLNFIQYKTNEFDIHKVDMEFLSMGRLFGYGLFSKEDLNEAWDAQKWPGHISDNILDYPKFGKTIGCKSE